MLEWRKKKKNLRATAHHQIHASDIGRVVRVRPEDPDDPHRGRAGERGGRVPLAGGARLQDREERAAVLRGGPAHGAVGHDGGTLRAQVRQGCQKCSVCLCVWVYRRKKECQFCSGMVGKPRNWASCGASARCRPGLPHLGCGTWQLCPHGA